jgi:hypothetical protein
MSGYPKSIKDAVRALCVELEKHFPEISKKFFDNHGFVSLKGASFEQRIQMGVYNELLKADISPLQTMMK